MRNLFNSIYRPKIKRNSFPLSYTNDFDTDFGLLVPVMIKETLAGEPWRLFNESFIRTQPLRCPAFMQADVSYHWFFVPNRLIYQDWTRFIVRGDKGDTSYDKPYAHIEDLVGGDVTNPVVQTVTPGSLFDFLNFPSFNDPSNVNADIVLAKKHKVDMMPFNVYNLIYNEYYRDENLQPEVFIWDQSGRTDNVNDLSDYVTEVATDYNVSASIFVNPFFIRHRAWRKDYFTSALPFVQKGSPISLIGSVQPASGDNRVFVHFSPTTVISSMAKNWFLQLSTAATAPDLYSWQLKIGANTGNNSEGDTHTHNPTNSSSPAVLRNAAAWITLPELQTNVMTISDLRVGLALQQFFELDARTGTDRYFEYLLGHFGVVDRDSRLQRPEYIGGYTHSIQISEVEQTSSTTSTSTPQGNLAGRGLGYSSNSAMLYRTPEPGWIMCIQSIRPRATYYQGWPREYQRWDSFDYYDSLFDHLSEQAIKTSELYYDPSIEPLSDDDDDFGYTPRFAEYRTSLNQCHNNFRYNLNYWISSRFMNTSPKLNSDFISIDGYQQKLYEMFAYPGTSSQPGPHFICHVVNHLKAIRPMSKYATPGL